MSEFNVPYSRASLTTIDITAAELEGANRGQRPDLIASEYTYRVMPGGALYQSNGTILEDATLVVTYKNGVMQAGGTNITPGGGGGGGGGGAPVALTASTTLTVADHANRDIDTTAASAITLTLPATAPTGTKFFGTNLGAGALSVVLDGGGAIPRNALLPPTIDQFSAWEVRRHASGWVRVA